MNVMRRGRARTGFTVVELLVVISIIAILAGLLLAVIVRQRGKGVEVRCASNLKQLALAAQMYYSDHDGRFPVRPGDLYPQYVTSNQVLWCPLSDPVIPILPEWGPLSDYFRFVISYPELDNHFRERGDQIPLFFCTNHGSSRDPHWGMGQGDWVLFARFSGTTQKTWTALTPPRWWQL